MKMAFTFLKTLIEDIAVEIDTLLEVASHDAATGKCQVSLLDKPEDLIVFITV